MSDFGKELIQSAKEAIGMKPTVTHFFTITTQESGIPRDPSHIGAFIREQFRTHGKKTSAETREQIFASTFGKEERQ